MKEFIPFTKTSSADWKKKVITDLKGKDYHELVKETPDGLTIEPLYGHENSSDIGTGRIQSDWWTHQTFGLNETEDERRYLDQALASGIGSIGIKCNDWSKAEALLNGILPQHIRVSLEVGGHAHLFPEFLEYLRKSVDQTSDLKADHLYRPLKGLLRGQEGQASLGELSKMMDEAKGLPSLGLCLVDGSDYHHAGADHVTEMALMSAEAIHLVRNTDSGLASRLRFRCTVDRDYLVSIAKLRAFRILWMNICEAEGYALEGMEVWSTGSPWEYAHTDEDTNLLRSSSQTMAAILGEADVIETPPHQGKKRGDALRLARNIHFLLRHESHLDKASGVTDGAYLFNDLTEQLVRKAWDVLLDIEEKGGWKSYLESGEMHSELHKGGLAKAEGLTDGSITWIGVNKYTSGEAGKLDIKWSSPNSEYGLIFPIIRTS